MQLIRRGRPAVLLATEQFTQLARDILRARGVSEAALVIVPGNPEYVTSAQLEALAADALECIAAALTGAAARRPDRGRPP